MRKPHRRDADKTYDQPEGKPTAVRARTDAASDHDTATVETTEPVKGDAKDPTDTEAVVGAQKIGDGEAVQVLRSAAPNRTNRRANWSPLLAYRALRRRAEGLQRRVRATATPPSDGSDENFDQLDNEHTESAEGEAKRSTDIEESGGAQDPGDIEATLSDDPAVGPAPEEVEAAEVKRRFGWARMLAYGVLPVLALLLTAGAGFLKWQDSSARQSQTARIESVAAAKDATIAMLSYTPDTVEKNLSAARERLTGPFRDSYTQLTNDVVIPGAKMQHVSATATVPDVASVLATPNHAVVLVFVNQTAVIDREPPTDSASSVRVTIDKIGGRWLISAFDPI